MQKTGAAPRRPRGRPQVRPDDETLRMTTDAARQEFLTRSFGEVSMASVAQRACVSTKTMYRLFPTKADLEPVEALTRILTVSGGLTLSADGIAMYRRAVMERDRFPDLATFFFESAIGPAGRILEDCGASSATSASSRSTIR